MTKTPIAVLGIDLGKNSCGLAGMDAAGSVVMRKRMTRDAIVTFAASLPTCIIAMEGAVSRPRTGLHLARRTQDQRNVRRQTIATRPRRPSGGSCRSGDRRGGVPS
jgi:hypothetical protein